MGVKVRGVESLCQGAEGVEIGIVGVIFGTGFILQPYSLPFRHPISFKAV